MHCIVCVCLLCETALNRWCPFSSGGEVVDEPHPIINGIEDFGSLPQLLSRYDLDVVLANGDHANGDLVNGDHANGDSGHLVVSAVNALRLPLAEESDDFATDSVQGRESPVNVAEECGEALFIDSCCDDEVEV